MTEMPSGRPSEPRTGPAAPAPAHGDGPTGPNAPTGHTGLRDQIAEALGQSITQWWQTPPRLDLAADAVLPVIEAHIVLAHVDATQRADLLAGRLEQAERERDTAREALDAAAIVIASLRDQRDEQRQRTENAEMEGRNILRRLDIADRLAGALEDERDKARAAVADEQRRADERSTELLEERDEALDALADAEKRAEQAERQRDQALNAIADERRGRLAVEAAVRRVRLVCMPPTAPDLRAEVLAALDAEQPKETP